MHDAHDGEVVFVHNFVADRRGEEMDVVPMPLLDMIVRHDAATLLSLVARPQASEGETKAAGGAQPSESHGGQLHKRPHNPGRL